MSIGRQTRIVRTNRSRRTSGSSKRRRRHRTVRYRRRLLVTLGAAIVLAGGVWLSLIVWPTIEQWTRLQEVVVSGLDHVSREEILSRLDLPEEVSLLALDLDDLRGRVETHPWVARASFDRVLPATLAIHVQERRGVAILRSPTERWLIDEDGRLLEKLSESDESRPVLVGLAPRAVEQRETSILERIRSGIHVAQLVGSAFPGTPRIDLSHPDMIVAEHANLRLTFGAAVEEQWKRFQLLYPSIRNRLTGKPQEVDLRYAQKIILRPRG